MILLALFASAVAILFTGIVIGIWISDNYHDEWHDFTSACEEMLRG